MIIVNCIDYIVQLVGINHVGIGLDFVLDIEEVNALVKQNEDLFPAAQNYANVNMNLSSRSL